MVNRPEDVLLIWPFVFRDRVFQHNLRKAGVVV